LIFIPSFKSVGIKPVTYRFVHFIAVPSRIDGIAFKSFIPKELKLSEHDQEMKIKLKNGSIMQIIGTDKYDAIRGTNPIGCVFSEYAYQNPQVWDVIRPILKINGGWAAFNTTPNGENHSHDLGKMASMNPEWFYEVLTVEDTGIVTEKDIEELSWGGGLEKLRR